MPRSIWWTCIRWHEKALRLLPAGVRLGQRFANSPSIQSILETLVAMMQALRRDNDEWEASRPFRATRSENLRSTSQSLGSTLRFPCKTSRDCLLLPIGRNPLEGPIPRRTDCARSILLPPSPSSLHSPNREFWASVWDREFHSAICLPQKDHSRGPPQLSRPIG